MTILGNLIHIIEDSEGTKYLIIRKDFLTWFDEQSDAFSNPNVVFQGQILRQLWGAEPDNYGLVGIDDYRVCFLRSQANQSNEEYLSNILKLIENTIELFYDFDEYIDKFDSPAPTGDVKILA